MDIYSTDAVAQGARASYWNELYSRRFAEVTFRPADSAGFEAELRMAAVGPLGIARVQARATDIERNRGHINRSPGRLFSFLLQARGSGVFSHYGHETRMKEGDFTLCDNAAPHRYHSADRTELIILRASPDVLKSCLPEPEQFCGLRLGAAEGLTGTAANMTQKLWSLVEEGLPEKFCGMLARNLLDLMATSYAMAFDAALADSSAVSARKIQARQYIDAHLRDPGLTPATVAAALGISARYLRMLFCGGEENASRYILRRRLQECARQLSSALWRDSTITAIAFSLGFNSAAHFTRVFRNEYGATPSQFRRAHLSRT